MLVKYIRILFFLVIFSSAAQAQQTAWFSINTNYKTGIELFNKGKYAAASEHFRQITESRMLHTPTTENALDLSLLKENAQFYQAVCALKLGNQDAENLFLTFIGDFPSSVNTDLSYFYIGEAYFDKKNYQKTIDWLDKINTTLANKDDLQYKFMMAYSYYSLNDNKSAGLIFSKLKDEKSVYQEASIYYYAFISYLNEDYKTSLAEFERLKGSKVYASSYPYYISALYFLDKRYNDVLAFTIPAISTINDQYKTEMYRIVGASFFAKENYQQAAEYYKLFQQRDQGKTQSNQDSYQMGYTHFKLKNYTAAITEFEKMDTPDIYYQNAMMALGESFIRTNNKQGARNAFFRASKLNFDKQLQEEGLFNYAKLSYELEFHEVALDAIQEFIKTYPGTAKITEAKVLLGEVLLSTKDYQSAVDIMESIPNRTGNARSIYQRVTYYRGLQFYNERAFENGISMFMRSIASKNDPEIEALATYWLAEAMFEVRKYGESVQQLEKFLALPAAKSTDVFNYANYALGYAAFQNENYSKASNYFTRFLRGNEKDQNTVNDATLRLADSYFVMKNYGQAMQQYDKIIQAGVKGEDYALFQRGMIQGLQGQNEVKISTLQSLLSQFPNSNYADDAGFEIGYTYFVLNNYDRAKGDLTGLVAKYPRSSYIPRALVTLGLVDYNQSRDDEALLTFKQVVSGYPTTDEAKVAMDQIKSIYLDRTDADGFLNYANSTNIGNLSVAEQDNFTFQVAYNRFVKGDYQGAYDGINAYFDKFPKPINDKHARFIRAESLVKLKRSEQAIPDYNYILNDWTSPYTERALMSISKVYMDSKRYNDAIVFLKKLETTSEYKSHYGYAVTNLIKAYSEMQMPDDVLKYAEIIRSYEKSSQEDKFLAKLYSAKAHLMQGDSNTAMREFTEVADQTLTVTAAEAKYNVGLLQYTAGNYQASQKTVLDLINKLSSYDYWVAMAYILMADNYVALKDEFQAKATLQSIIDNYDGADDDVVTTAKQKLQKLNTKK